MKDRQANKRAHQPSYRRNALAQFARRLRRQSSSAETVEDELQVEDFCDFALGLLEESKWKGAPALLEAAIVLADAAALAQE